MNEKEINKMFPYRPKRKKANLIRKRFIWSLVVALLMFVAFWFGLLTIEILFELFVIDKN